MVNAWEAHSTKFSVSSLKSSTSFVIIGTAIGGALAACATTVLLAPDLSIMAQAANGLAVAGAAAVVGALSSLGRLQNSGQKEVEALSCAVRSLLRDPNLVQRVPVYGSGAVGGLAADLNVLIDSFETRQNAVRDELIEARAMRDLSESASLAKSHFLANMSHELRTPLNAIIGYAMLLEEDAQEDGRTEVVSDLNRILRAARHLLTLINDILDLSKIEAGKDEVEYTLANVRALVDETMAAVGPIAKNNEAVEFKLELPDEEIYIHTDTMKVRQCLVNLLSNAFKFTESGQVSLSVSKRPAEFGSSIVFEVSDTGIGIEADKIEKLFDAFVQADASTTQKYGGTGLGLAITQRLTNLMGGELRLESVPGDGSVFTIILPQEPARENQNDRVADVSDEMPANDDNGLSRRAVVIDDDVSNVDLLSRWLRKQGYSVAAAYNGETGLALAREFQPDLILLDIHMPQTNGWDVLEELKKDQQLSEVPVVVISVDDNRRRGLDSGASEYLTKPTTQEHLSSVLETFNTTAKGHVLVIDDDEDAGNIVERAARQVGLEVSRAFDGVTGLDMARSHKPSAIVLDLTMPRKDGFSVLGELSTNAELRKIPVIIVSARTLNGDEFNQIAESGHDFHAKGVSSPHDIAANLISVVNS